MSQQELHRRRIAHVGPDQPSAGGLALTPDRAPSASARGQGRRLERRRPPLAPPWQVVHTLQRSSPTDSRSSVRAPSILAHCSSTSDRPSYGVRD
jgi:hypothetical protein